MKVRAKPLDEVFENFSFPEKGTLLSPLEAMSLTCEAALQGAGHVFSNPLVGAILLDQNHRFIDGAWHSSFGEPHAEQALIKKLQEKNEQHKFKGATLYTSLEPCAHIGKTPSCSHLLGELPLKKVVYASSDKTPKVSGKGLELLKDKGIQIERFSEPSKLLTLPLLTEHFESFERDKRPFVSLKIASTLNGVYAHKSSQREWITCERSRQYAHFLRLLYDAIVVGANTVIQDNPSLDCRHLKKKKTPLRLVIDPKGRALTARPPQNQNLIKEGGRQTVWCLQEEAFQKLPKPLQEFCEKSSLHILFLNSRTYSSPLAQVLHWLYERKIARVLFEGGGTLWGEALNSSLANKLYLFQAPKIFSGKSIMHWTKSMKINYLNLENCVMTTLEKDVLFEGLTN